MNFEERPGHISYAGQVTSSGGNAFYQIEQKLNELGYQGWELVSFVTWSDVTGVSGGVSTKTSAIAVLKRPR